MGKMLRMTEIRILTGTAPPLATLVKDPTSMNVHQVILPSDSEIHADFMKVGDAIQQRHRKAF
ncbi:MAG: hypothetical protein C7B47_17040 [Sulfobacillus thermosulfidooxidans]|uniref:Uncharacterized protein n=1 Tax=Sulfobacillus thermosulfidooxidans TaxID=28034 RepID=A0A2T2WI15_SULTH|nr:MAG: hypothetical protein C7B47_17040 [Sulfobacillus thermosulfidooxidans]